MHTYGSWEFFFSAAPPAQNSPDPHFRFMKNSILTSVYLFWVCDHYICWKMRKNSKFYKEQYTTTSSALRVACTLADSGFFKNCLHQGGVKSTVSWVFEDLKFKISEGYDQNWCFPDSAQLAVSV